MDPSVSPSTLATQPVGETVHLAEGVYQLKLPVPFPLGFVSSYLLRSPRGWTVVDPGFDYPPAREVWGRQAERLGLRLDADVERIVVTHLHPDHIGLARWLQERSGATVFMLEGEMENARRVWDPAPDAEGPVEFLMRHGMDEATARPTAAATSLAIRLPYDVVALGEGESVELGERRWQVIHTPGHSDFHFVLHEEERGVLLAGDQLLLRITPNIELWTHTAPRPLERYLGSIEGLKGLDADLVLPGHGPLFHDLDGRIDELVAHHEERLGVMHAAVDDAPQTAYEISRRVFADGLSDHQQRFALAETLAHLEHLVDDGRAERVEGEVVSYRAR
jgi:glyoxylase-like metal-dependent hydrolase (beta-lactamase superfamily II)